MENKVSDNVIEKIIGSALNSMKSTKAKLIILTWQQQKRLLKICMSYTKNGISTGRFTKDEDYVVRCDALVTLAEENKDSLFMMHGAYGLDTLYRWAMPDGMSCGRQYEPNLQGYFQSHT